MGFRSVAEKAAGFRISSISRWVVADIVLINPRFELSFWGLEHCMRLFGKRANLPVACLALLAALVPDRHQVTLLDENVEDIDFERLGRADLVCLTGMSIQGRRLIEILEECRARGVMTVVGGPMATVEPEVLESFADVIFIGEADTTWPEFLHEWERGCHKSRYEQPEKTDLTLLPLPRVELLKSDRYMFGSLQISRGCPFTCEFCDIIVTEGWAQNLAAISDMLLLRNISSSISFSTRGSRYTLCDSCRRRERASNLGIRRKRQKLVARRNTSSYSQPGFGLNSLIRLLRRSSNSAGSSPSVTMVLAKSACLREFMLERLLPSWVLGPVLRFALALFAAVCFAVAIIRSIQLHKRSAFVGLDVAAYRIISLYLVMGRRSAS